MQGGPIVSQGGRERFAEMLKNAMPMAEFLWRSELGAAPIDTPERMADLESRLMRAVNTIRDRTVRWQYTVFIREKLRGLRNPKRSTAPPLSARDRLVFLLLKNPGLLDEWVDDLDTLAAEDPQFAAQLTQLRRRKGH